MGDSFKITENMLNKLKYDEMTANSSPLYTTDKTIITPTVLIIFKQSDINAAFHHLITSMNKPFKPNAIATVLIEESIKDDFLEKLRNHMQPLNTSNRMLFELFEDPLLPHNIEHINTDGIIRLVCNLTHEHLNENSGIVTMHHFRTLKECIQLIEKESLLYTNASIWHKNHAYAYELIAALKCKNNYINCHNVSLPPAIQTKFLLSLKTYAFIYEGYHYERLLFDDMEKYVTFSIGSIFAN